jgi:hypothetical protein
MKLVVEKVKRLDFWNTDFYFCIFPGVVLDLFYFSSSVS